MSGLGFLSYPISLKPKPLTVFLKTRAMLVFCSLLSSLISLPPFSSACLTVLTFPCPGLSAPPGVGGSTHRCECSPHNTPSASSTVHLSLLCPVPRAEKFHSLSPFLHPSFPYRPPPWYLFPVLVPKHAGHPSTTEFCLPNSFQAIAWYNCAQNVQLLHTTIKL